MLNYLKLFTTTHTLVMDFVLYPVKVVGRFRRIRGKGHQKDGNPW